MENKTTDILIIGAGLTGLTLAYLLRKEKYAVKIVEARERIGGRIHTLYKRGEAPQEMGATWLGKKHKTLVDLLQELKVDTFEQVLSNRAIYEPISTSPPQLVQLPPNEQPSFRIVGGTSTLINALFEQLDSNQVMLGEPVVAIRQEEEAVTVSTKNYIFKAKVVVSTLPPFLLQKTVKMNPVFTDETAAIIEKTHTWMGNSIKISLTYDVPFWREANSSGTIVSNVGPIPEMYDHANVEDNLYALKGFLNGAYFGVSRKERLDLIMKQLGKYYGPKAANYKGYEELVWHHEKYTFVPYKSYVLPHQNNGHLLYQTPFWKGKLFIAGSETAKEYPGYMDGAVSSAHFVYETIKKSTNL